MCNLKCNKEATEDCLEKYWVNFEPESELICKGCPAWKGQQCRLQDGVQCGRLSTIVFTLVDINVRIYKMVEDEVIPRMRGV